MRRSLFRLEIKARAGRKVFWTDECGVDHRLYRQHARAPRGEKIYQTVAGSRRGRTSILSAYDGEKLVAPILCEGSCDRDLFNEWLEKYFLPVIPEGSVGVLDNASFHRSPQSREIAGKFQVELLFLPTCSPDLNRIEPKWDQLKSLVKKNPNTENRVDSIGNAILMLL